VEVLFFGDRHLRRAGAAEQASRCRAALDRERRPRRASGGGLTDHDRLEARLGARRRLARRAASRCLERLVRQRGWAVVLGRRCARALLADLRRLLGQRCGLGIGPLALEVELRQRCRHARGLGGELVSPALRGLGRGLDTHRPRELAEGRVGRRGPGCGRRRRRAIRTRRWRRGTLRLDLDLGVERELDRRNARAGRRLCGRRLRRAGALGAGALEVGPLHVHGRAARREVGALDVDEALPRHVVHGHAEAAALAARAGRHEALAVVRRALRLVAVARVAHARTVASSVR
jgi:hypothetical protein